MDSFSSNSTLTGSRAVVISDLVNGAQDLRIFYASAAAALTALLLGGLESGRKIISRVLWFIDGLLGGAPHSVTLPGPPGLPIVGNLLEVSLLSTVLLLKAFLSNSVYLSYDMVTSQRSPNGPRSMATLFVSLLASVKR